MTSENELRDVIPLKAKLAYSGASSATNLLSGIGLTAITFFYNVKLGLSGELIGIAWLIFAAWNAINDPLFGYLEDKTRTGIGRRIPYLRYGAPIYGLTFIFCWFPLVDVNNEIALFLYLLLVLFAFDTIFTILGLITYSLPAEMAISAKERASLLVYSTLIGGIGTVISFILPVVLLTGDETTGISPDFYIIMIILGITCALIIFGSSYFIKENKYAMLEEPLGIIEAIKETFKNKPFMIYMVAVFVLLFMQNIITTAIYYYIDYVLNLSGFMSIIPVLMLFGVIFVFTIVFSRAIQKFGVKRVLMFGQIYTGISLLLLFFLGWELILAVFSLFLVGIGISALLISTHVTFTDTIDYDETKTEKRRETTYSGVQALLTKPAISLANWLFLVIISTFGFQEELTYQSDFTKLGIMFGFTIIPAIGALLSTIVIIYYPLDGSEWMEQKRQLMLVHEKKEKEYLEYLKKEGKL